MLVGVLCAISSALLGIYQWTQYSQALELKKFDAFYARRWADEVLTSWMEKHGDRREASLRGFSKICSLDTTDKNHAITYTLVYVSKQDAQISYQVHISMDLLFVDEYVLELSKRPSRIPDDLVQPGPWSCTQ